LGVARNYALVEYNLVSPTESSSTGTSRATLPRRRRLNPGDLVGKFLLRPLLEEVGRAPEAERLALDA